jgi:HCOMODA/2-hydroxy-3-carboxy-muconic semialdehyde decarboxylase
MSVEEVIPAANALARGGLVDAFGHVSARVGDAVALTPARPLGSLLRGDELVELPLDASELPEGAPKEVWIHLEIYKRRGDVGGICRAQPAAVNQTSGAGLLIRALHGQGAFVGAEVAVHDDATLVRSRELAIAVAECLGDGDAVVLRGNGAVTVGSTPGVAAARMVVLEASAKVNLAAASVGSVRPLSDAEVSAWRGVAPELLARLWAYLRSL